MNQQKSGSLVVGVDVGGPKKGFHAVALRDAQYREQFSTFIATELAAWCRKLKASVVGIDAPCRWSLAGRARPCERALAAEGLHTFATPSQAKGETHPFYRWMVNGADLYRCLAPDYHLIMDNDLYPVRCVSRRFLMRWFVRWQASSSRPDTSERTVPGCSKRQGL